MNLAQCSVLIVGGGNLARQKLATLAATGADVTVAAPMLREDLADWGGHGRLTLLRQPYGVALLRGQTIVFAATDDPVLNHQVVSDARAAGIPVNAVDDPQFCDFFTPSVVRRGPFTLAISSAGAFPGACKALRETLELLLPEADNPALASLMALRARLRADPALAERRGAALKALAARFYEAYLHPLTDRAPAAVGSASPAPASPAPIKPREHDA